MGTEGSWKGFDRWVMRLKDFALLCGFAWGILAATSRITAVATQVLDRLKAVEATVVTVEAHSNILAQHTAQINDIRDRVGRLENKVLVQGETAPDAVTVVAPSPNQRKS